MSCLFVGDKDLKNLLPRKDKDALEKDLAKSKFSMKELLEEEGITLENTGNTFTVTIGNNKEITFNFRWNARNKSWSNVSNAEDVDYIFLIAECETKDKNFYLNVISSDTDKEHLATEGSKTDVDSNNKVIGDIIPCDDKRDVVKKIIDVLSNEVK